MRCVKDEHSAINMNLHYLENGTVMLNFVYQKELFFLPLGFVLKVVIRFLLYITVLLACFLLIQLIVSVLSSRPWWTSQTSRSTRS